MPRRKIGPINNGALTISHHVYFRIAQELLKQAKDLRVVLEQKIAEVKQKAGRNASNVPEDDRRLVSADYRQVLGLVVATQLFACMTVESFLNYYGVQKLGEQYYKRNLERLGISQKLETLIAISTQELLDEKDEIVTTVRRMFERRNRLAHPKSKEITIDDKFVFPKSPDELEQAENSVKDMIAFFRKFQEI